VDVNRSDYPDTSVADFSFLVPAPSGTHGFVTTQPDGHFYFEDGKRAKFWGINVSSASIPIPDADIDAAVERFQRAGINMLRLEAADNGGMLLDTPVKNSSRNINAMFLRKMHRWMWQAKKHGLYVYLQLLDFRTFHSGDGVVNADLLGRAAKPYAFFDPKLISLQKEFARQILLTPNPFTKKAPIADPSVAVIELANEHGLFMKGDIWRKMPAPYDKQFQGLWNDYLRKRYKTTTDLDKAWTSPDGKHALHASEKLEAGTVEVPDMSAMDSDERAAADWTDVARSPARVDDGARFAYEVQRTYFREMRAYLRGLGVKIPITAVVSAWIAPDVKSVADELDFTAENWYWDHPAFEPNKEWQHPFYYANTDPLANTGSWSAPPYMSFLKWKGKPVIIREWAAVWPNEYRASSVPLAAAYASFQDLDGMLAFGYQFTGKNKLGDFNYERDPVRWGLMGLGALMFLRGDVKPSQDLAELVYSDSALFTYRDYLNALYRLAFVIRLEQVPASEAGKRKTALTVDAQPAIPPDALNTALDILRKGDSRTIGTDLTRCGTTGETQILGLDTALSALNIISSRSIALAGRLSSFAKLYPGFTTGTPYGCFWVASLDGKQLDQSDHYLIKMVSVAKNTGEEFAPSDGPFYRGKFALKTLGTTPIITKGQPSADNPTRFSFVGDAGAPASALEVDMINGTWEFERQGDLGRFVCDTPGIQITVPGAATVTAVLSTGQSQPVTVTDGAFKYPGDVDRVDIRFTD
jgi:hypothetical protein